MKEKVMTRIKNPKVIMATVAGLLMILVNLGFIDAAMSEQVENTLNSVLAILIGVGVFSNPESHVPPAE